MKRVWSGLRSFRTLLALRLEQLSDLGRGANGLLLNLAGLLGGRGGLLGGVWNGRWFWHNLGGLLGGRGLLDLGGLLGGVWNGRL